MRDHIDNTGFKRTAAVAAVALAIAAAGAGAQVPGSPALQNAFANPGLAVAANSTGGGGQSFFGAAAGYGLGSGRLQASAAAGVQRANTATRGAYGGRVAATVWTSASQSLAAGVFAGLGGAMRTRTGTTVTNPAVTTIPVGLTVGYRHSLGQTRGFSAYVSPVYRWTRLQAETSTSTGSFGGALGLDVSLTQSFGATIGTEIGKSSGTRSGTSSTFGAAISFVPGR